ncbi:MAG: epoxyqueuosine reductase QueH [Candidatus Wallbacteria bacterium]
MKNLEKISEKILLHICCAPCASVPLFELPSAGMNLTGFFYNPNIYDDTEKEKRRREVEKIEKFFNVGCVYLDDTYERYLEFVKGLEAEPEGGSRCLKCFEMRLLKAFEYASMNDFSYVTTTLTISPHKNSGIIHSTGNLISEKFPGIKFLEFDFKKKEGYKKSIQLCRQYSIYRQNYCGCHFSKKS